MYDRLKAGGRNWNTLLAWNYVGLIQIATSQLLAGPHAPYRELFILSTGFVGAVHPPRRLAPCLALVNAVTVAPLFFEPWDPLRVDHRPRADLVVARLRGLHPQHERAPEPDRQRRGGGAGARRCAYRAR